MRDQDGNHSQTTRQSQTRQSQTRQSQTRQSETRESQTTRGDARYLGPRRGGRWEHRRALSQNFLYDPGTIARIVRAARPGADDLLVEVGAGEGRLTRALARECRKVIAYEIDAALARRVAARYRSNPKIECVHADFLSATPPAEPFALVGNIPYGVTSRIVEWCLKAPELTSATMVTQLDYARKRSGDRGRWSRLTVRTWPRFDWRLLGVIPRELFRPVPSVDSGILRLDRRREALLPPGALREYEAFVALGFGGVGGTLHASLSRRYRPARVTAAFAAAGLDRRTIVAFVHPDQWIQLFTALHRR
ncbi:ErmE/ErmH/ErmO/ErmR family 23S rRNA (adenine(2058)-N(6))-methyltransferase [Actinomadura alba]|uniref:ErmE/ErmH/ErmO/ErmR family 23S rRNA (Adenine(2058)-N(6))-methyltransferase n=1 Tax=Actinomadura alba TaxID=406431 RepID=A0ABR7LPK3_9ACTN|nr:ErmE/ErmH/ErmO/ErmR family 23S rRNA (adenine(2058)-N(6))-methyltransferase [Actinomadura alba]MBC6466771.1 ErmE/ErmH/ErmO/ErmR family 23S rRNA (adenine(2058)-N(6))-methyltransferase [Actinomadura alba]